MKCYLWGMGQRSKLFLEWAKKYDQSISIIGVVDSFSKRGCDFNGYPVISKNDLLENFLIVIAIDSSEIVAEIIDNLVLKLRVDEKRIVHYTDIINDCRRRRIIEKYSDKDKEVGEIVAYLKNGNPLSVRNQYKNKNKVEYKVFFDNEIDYPYVEYYGKRMYYPKDFNFEKNKYGEPILINVVEEDQYPESPHLYITDSHAFEGGVLGRCRSCRRQFCTKVY